MKINNIDISSYNCICKKFKPSTSTYKFEGSFNKIKGFGVETLRSIDAEFIFSGTKDTIQRNISKFIENIKESIIESSSFFYDVILEGESNFDLVSNCSVILPLKLTLINMYEGENRNVTTTNTTININSPKQCYANLELRATTNVISYTVKINDTEIVVRNIKGNEVVYIGSGKVVAGDKSKMNDVDMWEFPKLNPGINNITVNRADVNLTIKYNERW